MGKRYKRLSPQCGRESQCWPYNMWHPHNVVSTKWDRITMLTSQYGTDSQCWPYNMGQNHNVDLTMSNRLTMLTLQYGTDSQCCPHNVEQTHNVDLTMWNRLTMLTSQCRTDSQCWPHNVEQTHNVDLTMSNRLTMLTSQYGTDSQCWPHNIHLYLLICVDVNKSIIDWNEVLILQIIFTFNLNSQVISRRWELEDAVFWLFGGCYCSYTWTGHEKIWWTYIQGVWNIRHYCAEYR